MHLFVQILAWLGQFPSGTIVLHLWQHFLCAGCVFVAVVFVVVIVVVVVGVSLVGWSSVISALVAVVMVVVVFVGNVVVVIVVVVEGGLSVGVVLTMFVLFVKVKRISIRGL